MVFFSNYKAKGHLGELITDDDSEVHTSHGWRLLEMSDSSITAMGTEELRLAILL